MRKTLVTISKKVAACGLAAALILGAGPLTGVSATQSRAADDTYTYLYADLDWSEYWAAENIYLKDGKTMADANETTDARGETDKGAFDAVSRATTNHGLHRGSFQCDAEIFAENGNKYTVSYWVTDENKNQSFYTPAGEKIGFSKGELTFEDGTTTKMTSYEVTGIKYVPVAVKTADLADFESKYSVVENGGKLVGGYSENNLKAYEETAEVTKDTNGLKVAEKQADGTYTFGARQTGTDSGVKDAALATAAKTVATVVTDDGKKGTYGEFLRMDITSEDGAGADEGYGPLGSKMQAVKWTYYGTDSTRTKAIATYGTKFAADNWMHKAMGIQLGLTESYRAELPSGTDGTGYWNVTIYGLGYADTSYDIEVTEDGISENVTPSEAVDTSKLQSLVDDVKKLNAADYTEASWKEVQGELAEAEEELAKSAHYESMVNEAYSHLKAAVDALEKKAVEPNPTQEPNVTPSSQPDPVEPSETPSADKKSTIKNKKPAIKKAVSKKKKAALVQWSKLSGATGYEVQYSLNKNMKKASAKKVKTVNVTLKKLKAGKTYYVRVRATAKESGKNVVSKWSAVKKVKIKK